MGSLQSTCRRRKTKQAPLDCQLADSQGRNASPQGIDVHHSRSGSSSTFPYPLIPISSTIAFVTDRLCSTCAALGLSVEGFIVQPEDQESGETITLGVVQDIRDKQHCPFCRLVLQSLGGPDVPTSDNGNPVSIMIRWSTSGTFLDPEHPSNTNHKVRNILTYAAVQGGRNVRPKPLYTNPKITLLANDSPTKSKVLFPRLTKKDGIDLDLTRSWIKMCEIHHGLACNKSDYFSYESENPAEQIPSFRLLDVIDNHIVCSPKDRKYFALSYVWGRVDVLKSTKSNIGYLEQPGSLLLPEYREKIPRTIWDAMQITKDMKFRYLWVDSLCIIQDDDTGSKAEAIAKMDLVYSACFLTIIATGAHANAGIAGVYSNARGNQQLVEEITPNFRLAAQSPIYNYMQDSVYSTRAWTFQERQFAPRNLTFVGGQVTFSCGKASWQEDSVDNPNMLTRVTPPITVDLGSFSGTVQSYSKLSLSFDSDIHNAFAGLARYFKTNLGVELVYGIPDKYFDWCLLWMPHAHHERREGAPSWSWTGWRGQSWNRFSSWFSREPAKVFGALQRRTWIIWYHRVAHESTKCTRVWEGPCTGDVSLSSCNFYGGKPRQRFLVDCNPTLPTSRTLTGAPKYYPDIQNTGSGFLQFWTVSVTFSLGTPTSKPPRLNFDSRLPHIRVGVFGRDGHEVSALYIDQKWCSASGHIPGEHEFILLCEGRDERPQTGEDDENGWKYMVMLIDYRGQREWAERVALGSISKADVGQGLGRGQVWKEIILG